MDVKRIPVVLVYLTMAGLLAWGIGCGEGDSAGGASTKGWRFRLSERLGAKRTELATKMPAGYQAAFDATMAQLRRERLVDRALTVGDKAPAFALPDAGGQAVRLENLLAKGPIILTFYRGGWCPYCTLELQTWQEALPDVRKLGATLVAVSPQSLAYSKKTVADKKLDFIVLSDAGNKLAGQFGIAFELPEVLSNTYKELGVELTVTNDTDRYELPLPATYVIDRDGVIRYAFVEPDFTQRAEPGDVLEAVATLGRARPGH